MVAPLMRPVAVQVEGIRLRVALIRGEVASILKAVDRAGRRLTLVKFLVLGAQARYRPSTEARLATAGASVRASRTQQLQQRRQQARLSVSAGQQGEVRA